MKFFLLVIFTVSNGDNLVIQDKTECIKNGKIIAEAVNKKFIVVGKPKIHCIEARTT